MMHKTTSGLYHKPIRINFFIKMYEINYVALSLLKIVFFMIIACHF